MRANQLMKDNIAALLRARGQTKKDLAQYCRRSQPWISKILKEPRREFPMKYFDRIADFFGIATYQLLQPGISHLTERRSGRDRRSGQERRLSRAQQTLQQAASPADVALLLSLQQLSAADRAHVLDVIHEVQRARKAGQTPAGAAGHGGTPSGTAEPAQPRKRGKKTAKAG